MALAVFLMYGVVIVEGGRDLTACRMRATVSFKALCLSVPGNPCCTAGVWQGREGSREDDREMASLSAKAYPSCHTDTSAGDYQSCL